MFVQFDDANLNTVQSVFSCRQDDDAYPNQGEIDESDERYIKFVDSLLPSKQDLNNSHRDSLLSVAALRISPLQDAVDLELATKSELSLLKAWKQYRVDLNRVNTSEVDVKWPEPPAE